MGVVAAGEGALDDYRRLVLATADDEGQDGASKSDERRSRTETRRAAAERRAELAPLKRRITALETEMAKLGGRMAEIDQALADPKIYENDPGPAAKLAKERAAAVGALAGAQGPGV